MAQSEAEWLEQRAQRLLGNQKSAVDTAKLLTTFVAAIAATLVATALQVDPIRELDHRAVTWLAWCVGATIVTILLDRLQAPDHTKVLAEKTLNGWSSTETLTQLRIEELATVRFNRWIVWAVEGVVAAQILLATVAGTLATVSLLLPDNVP